MTPGARVQTLLDMLTIFCETRHPADQVLHAYMRGKKHIGSHDRRWLSQHFFQCFRQFFVMSQRLKDFSAEPLDQQPRLWGILYIALFEKDLLSTFDGQTYHPSPLNNKEKDQVNKLPPLTEENISPLFCPQWLLPHLTRIFGNNLKEHSEAWSVQAPLHLRVNILKSTRDTILKTIITEGFKAEALNFSPYGLSVSSKLSSDHSLLKEGKIAFQDEGSQLVAMACNVQPTEYVLDLCAGAGGKTLALAMMMKNKGRIVACDIFEWRLKRAQERFRAAGVHNVQCRLLDAQGLLWLKRQKGKFDCVLIDAPCSGTGTWRRNPDLAIRMQPHDLQELLLKQNSIMALGATVVKPKGRLVYATCSFLEEENQHQIKLFLDTHPDFKLDSVPLPTQLFNQAGASSESGMINLTPLEHGTDGFFIAHLLKE